MIQSRPKVSHLFSLGLAFFLLFFSLPLVTAVEPSDIEYTFKQNTNVPLKRECVNNGTWCSPSAVCNITIVSTLTQTLIKNNTQMSNQLSFHTTTLTPSNNIELGTYRASKVCIDGTFKYSETFYYNVTPSGNDLILGLHILLVCIVYFISFFSAYHNNYVLTVMGGLSMIILGLYTLNNGIDIFRNFATEAFSYFTIAIGSYFGITSALRMFEND